MNDFQMYDKGRKEAEAEAQTDSSCLDVISGSPTFKEQLLNNFIPRIEAMAEKQRLHLHYLINIDAPIDFIQSSQKTHFHFLDKIKEYQDYAERL
jgi:hypothetical protein